MKLLNSVCGRSTLTKDGSELLDTRPVEMPIGFEHPESIQQMIRRLVQDRVISSELDSHGIESFSEADDFEVPDDLPVQSPYEENFDPLGIVTRDQEIRSGTVSPVSDAERAAAAAQIAKHKRPAPPIQSKGT